VFAVDWGKSWSRRSFPSYHVLRGEAGEAHELPKHREAFRVGLRPAARALFAALRAQLTARAAATLLVHLLVEHAVVIRPPVGSAEPFARGRGRDAVRLHGV